MRSTEDIMIKTIILFATADSIKPIEVIFTSENNKNKPNARNKAVAKKHIMARGVALPGADTVGGTLPVPI